MTEVAIDQPAVLPTNWGDTDLYRFFARVFAPPSVESFAFLARPTAADDLQALASCVGCKEESAEFTWFSAYDLYESAYISLFDVGLPEPVVPLFESAHDKTHPAQEVALENTYFYDVLGLRSDPATGVPDYLVTQLEFLAAVSFTKESTSDESTRASLARVKSEFLERHLLNWLPTAAAKLDKTEAAGFPFLMDLLVKFLRSEQSTHEAQGMVGTS